MTLLCGWIWGVSFQSAFRDSMIPRTVGFFLGLFCFVVVWFGVLPFILKVSPYVVHAGLKLTVQLNCLKHSDPPDSAFWVLGLWTTDMPQPWLRPFICLSPILLLDARFPVLLGMIYWLYFHHLHLSQTGTKFLYSSILQNKFTEDHIPAVAYSFNSTSE